MIKIVIDTNIIINYVRIGKRGKTLLEKIISQPRLQLIISVATLQELFIGQSTKNKKEERKIKKLLNLFIIKDIDPSIAETAGKILRDYPGKLSFPDAKIAATAILEKALLLTRNKKDFAKIKRVKFYE